MSVAIRNKESLDYVFKSFRNRNYVKPLPKGEESGRELYTADFSVIQYFVIGVCVFFRNW